MSESPNQEPFAGDVPGFTLHDFERTLQTVLSPDGIHLRIEEDVDGTRLVHAWHRISPGSVSIFVIDDVRLGPYQADMVAGTIRKSFS